MLLPARLLFIGVVSLFLSGAGQGGLSGLPPSRHELTTHIPGEPPRIWRSMRTIWKFSPGQGEPHGISEMLLHGGVLLYVSEAEAGCVDKNNGKVVWRRSFLTKAQSDPFNFRSRYDWFKISADDKFVYTMEGRWSGNEQPDAYHLRALRLGNGAIAWQKSLNAGSAGTPAPAGKLLIVPLANGTVRAVNRTNGATVWETNVGGSSSMAMSVVAGHVVVQVGANSLTALHLRDGSAAWSYPRSGARFDGDTEGLSVKNGVVYALLGSRDLVAIEVATGRKLWGKETMGGGTPSPATHVLGELVVATPFGELSALRRKDGKTAWTGERHRWESRREGPMVLRWKSDPGGVDRSGMALFDVLDGLPLINGEPRKIDVRLIWPPGTVIMRDAYSGRERWRWQPEDGVMIRRLLSDGDRLFVSDGASIRAVEEGRPVSLPIGHRERLALAERQITNYQLSNENKLTLLRLGPDSVPALLKQVKKEARERDQRPVRPEDDSYRLYSFPDGLQDATCLLVEIGDKSCILPIVSELKTSKHPIGRMLLAQSLIRLADRRSYDALFDYARVQPNDPRTQEDALFLLRTAKRETAISNRLTEYLLARVADNNAPTWLRLFARFELLNDRGDKARAAALASFEGDRKVAKGNGRLSDEGAIFEAVVEALCQVGRSTPKEKEELSRTKPIRFGATRTPLVLRFPPGSSEITIMGHPGPVSGKPIQTDNERPAGFLLGGMGVGEWTFTKPHIDFAGDYHDYFERQSEMLNSLRDPFAPAPRGDKSPPEPSFRDYFPYEMSPDRTRARVGWEQSLGGMNGEGVHYDIEVRKLGGQWYPTECRIVYSALSRHWGDSRTLPKATSLLR